MNMRDQLAEYFKRTECTREWFAEKVGYSKRTVDNWMAGEPMPLPAVKLFNVLRNEATIINVGFTMEEFSKVSAAMEKTHYSDPIEFLIEAARAETDDVNNGEGSVLPRGQRQINRGSILDLPKELLADKNQTQSERRSVEATAPLKKEAGKAIEEKTPLEESGQGDLRRAKEDEESAARDFEKAARVKGLPDKGAA